MRISEKALRQLKDAPPHDCGTHPETVYAKVPGHLRAVVGYSWACAKCLKEKQNEYDEQLRQQRAKRRAEREQERVTRTTARTAAIAAQDALLDALAASEARMESAWADISRSGEEAPQRAARTRSCMDAVEAAHRALQAAKRDLAVALAAESSAVTASTFRSLCVEVAAVVDDAMRRSDEAWAQASKNQRKTRYDHNLRRRADAFIARAKGYSGCDT